jgi:hypothetical protein
MAGWEDNKIKKAGSGRTTTGGGEVVQTWQCEAREARKMTVDEIGVWRVHDTDDSEACEAQMTMAQLR